MLIKYAGEFHVSTDYLLDMETAKRINVEQLSEYQISILNTLVNEFISNNKR